MDVHPEELIDIARHGRLSARERERLTSHLRYCDACALELLAGKDFDAIGGETKGDAEILDRVTRTALLRLKVTNASLTESGEIRRVLPKRVLATTWSAAAAMVLVFACGTVAAAVWVAVVQSTQSTEQEARPPKRKRIRKAQHISRPVRVPRAPEAQLGEKTKPVLRSRRLRDAPRQEPSAAPNAAALLKRADNARYAGRATEAAKLYRILQLLHPGSREQRVSRVALGRLLLDRLKRPAEALEQFVLYLRDKPSDTLALEARLGRALALKRLGRTPEEKAAWKDLLRHHALSPQAELARARLEQLGEDPWREAR